LDLILGGHDHVNMKDNINGTYVVKSGSDFMEFNKIELNLLSEEENHKGSNYKGKYSIDIETVKITKAFEPDQELEEFVKQHLEKFEEHTKEPLFHTKVDLDTRIEKVRTTEQNFSNLIADIIRIDSDCDVALINCGTFRSDCVFQAGVLTLYDIMLAFPWEDLIFKVKLSGELLWKALECSVEVYPPQDGRFLAVFTSFLRCRSH